MVCRQFTDADQHVQRLHYLVLFCEPHLASVVAGSLGYACPCVTHHAHARVDEDVFSDEYVLLYWFRSWSLSFSRVGGVLALCVVASRCLLFETRWRILVRILVIRGGDQCRSRALVKSKQEAEGMGAPFGLAL